MVANLRHGWPVGGVAASVDPPESVPRVHDRVSAELARILARPLDTAAAVRCGDKAPPVGGARERLPAAATETKLAIPGPVGVTQNRYTKLKGGFEERDRRRRGERDANDATRKSYALFSDLDEVLVAGRSAQVSHEDEHHCLTAVGRQPHRAAVRCQER